MTGNIDLFLLGVSKIWLYDVEEKLRKNEDLHTKPEKGREGGGFREDPNRSLIELRRGGST